MHCHFGRMAQWIHESNAFDLGSGVFATVPPMPGTDCDQRASDSTIVERSSFSVTG